MEGWRGGGVEGWRDGGVEGWRDGSMEEGKGEASVGEGREVGEGRWGKERRKGSTSHTNCALQVSASLIHKMVCMRRLGHTSSSTL